MLHVFPPLFEIEEMLGDIPAEYLSVRIAVLRNISMENLEPYVQYLGIKDGLSCTLKFGEFDNIFQEAVGTASSLIDRETDVVTVFLFLEKASPKLSSNFCSMTPEELQGELSRLVEEIRSIIQGIRSKTDALILWHGFEKPAYPALGILDVQKTDGQSQSIDDLNIKIRSMLADVSNAYFVDMNICLMRVGHDVFYDRRYWFHGLAPYSRRGLQEIASEDLKYIRPLFGKARKCLVLDCDNTLWGGVVGEDGLNGIKLGKDGIGASFSSFQEEIVNLYCRGVIICLCSKNNEEDVWEVFEKHPDMVLKRAYVAAAKINWDDKAQNLRRLASELNIGLDSMVFMDDSLFECQLVSAELPEVHTIQLPKDQPYKYHDILGACGVFDTLVLSSEDKSRGAMYQAESERRQLRIKATNLEEYYQSLEMAISIRFADDYSIPRIAQQTQKTNQFNLTTKRYSEADIVTFVNDANTDVVTLALSDRFGDSGIVGTCIITYQGDVALIDSLLISCRVLGRGVENEFLNQVVRLARSKGYGQIFAVYTPSLKNVQVERFYLDRGFEMVGIDDSGSTMYSLGKGVELNHHYSYFTVDCIDLS